MDGTFDDVAVIYPTYNKSEIADLDRMREWGATTRHLHILAQGAEIPEGALSRGTNVYHTSDGLGTWGSQFHWLIDDGSFAQSLLLSGVRYVLVYLQRTWSIEQARSLVELIKTEQSYHAHAWRSDIASALSKDPDVGRARAIGECWLATAGLLALGQEPGVVLDGFSGLVVLTFEEYLSWDRWKWTDHGKVNWGGAWMNQAITIASGKKISGKVFGSEVPRTALSHTFNEEPVVAVSQMFCKLIDNKFFSETVRPEHYIEAARVVTHYFSHQPCFQGLSQDDTQRIIRKFVVDFHEWYGKETFLVA